jgi:hypothetical protein
MPSARVDQFSKGEGGSGRNKLEWCVAAIMVNVLLRKKKACN